MSLRPTDAVLMPPPPKLGSPRRAKSCPERGATDSRAPKKRRRLSEVPETNEELIQALTGASSSRPRGRPRDPKKAPLTATHELRLLRAQVANMEEELDGLKAKWSKQLPEERTLSTARHSAREKYATDLAERAHKELQQLLRQQQLMFATLQTAVLHAPLHSNGNDMFEALHFDTQLGSDHQQRETMLTAHNERSLATLPSIVDKFSQLAIDKAMEGQDATIVESVMPLSQINITGGQDCTLISSVFISEIPHTSLEDVYAAVLAYFAAIPTSLKRHFGVEANRTRLNDAESKVVYRQSTFNGSGLPATVNNIVCSELTTSHGMVHIDAVTDDPLHPVPESSSSQYGICGLTITPRKEPVTGKTLSITLRWVVVYRYNMLPHDPAIRRDLEIIRPILNGDLLTASICSHIQEQQTHRRKSSK